MFLTLDHAEHQAGTLLKHGHLWRYVEYLSAKPWFYVAVREDLGEGGPSRPAILLLYEVEDLKELADLDGSNLEIEKVWLVSPRSLNQTNEWRMDELREVVKLVEDEETCLAYVVAKGKTFFQKKSFRLSTPTNREVIFRAKSVSSDT